MFRKAALIAFSLVAVGYAQQAGTQTAETHPSLTWETCTTGGSCTQNAGSVTLDSNWRWVHDTTGCKRFSLSLKAIDLLMIFDS